MAAGREGGHGAGHGVVMEVDMGVVAIGLLVALARVLSLLVVLVAKAIRVLHG